MAVDALSRIKGLSIALALAVVTAGSVSVPARAEIPTRAFVQDTAFERVGCGMRRLLFSDIYILCLYDGPSSASMLQMDIVYEGDMPDGIPDDWRPHLIEVISDETIARINASFAQLSTGDIVQFAYLPLAHLSALLVNGEVKVSNPGMELYDTVQAMWLGDEPISKRLKKNILGHACDVC